MTHSPLTNQIRLSPQYSSRQGVQIDTFLIHHQAGTNDDAVINAMISGSREVSANYTISNEGRITCVVDENYRAWTSGSSSDGGRGAAWDRRSITVEIENEAGAPNWTISEAALRSAALLLNDLRTRYTINNVLGHRDLWNLYRASYATFCPGPNTVAAIVAKSGSVLDPEAVEAEKDRVRKIGTYLNTLGLATFKTAAAVDGIPLDRGETYSRYWNLVQLWGRKYRPDAYPVSNSIDGIVGPNTRKVEAIIWSMLQAGTAPSASTPAQPQPPAIPAPQPSVSMVKTPNSTYVKVSGDGLTYWEPRGELGKRIMRGLRKYGYTGPIDGVFGPNTRKAIQRAAREGGYTGPIDGALGRNTIKGVQTYARRGGYKGIVDGIPAELTWNGFATALER